MLLTEEHGQRLAQDPGQQYEERNPKQRELNRKIDRFCVREGMGSTAAVEEIMPDQVREADETIPGERYKWQQNKTEPFFGDT